MRTTLVIVLVCVLASAACAQHAAPPPGAPQFAVVQGVQGAPPDSAGGHEFWVVFRSTFLQPWFAIERPSGRLGAYAVSVPMSNRFALLEGSGAASNSDAYRVQVTLEWLKAPPAARAVARPRKPAPKASSGQAKPRSTRPTPVVVTPPARAFVSVMVVPPGVDPAIVRIAPASDTLTFSVASDPTAAYGASIGRIVASLVLEHLHHLSGDLDENERIQIERAERRRPAAEGPMRR